MLDLLYFNDHAPLLQELTVWAEKNVIVMENVNGVSNVCNPKAP